MDFPAFRALHLHRDHGLNLLFPLLPLHGPRRGPGMVRGSMLSFELVDTVSALGQAVWDVRRLLAWARHEGARRIVLYGLSVGAYTAALVSALEDVDLVLCGIPLSDIPTLFARHTPEHFRTLAHHFDLAGPQVQEMFRPVSPLTLLPRVALARRRIYAGLADRVTPPSQAEQLWEAWGRPSIEWFDGGHLSAQWSGQVDRFVDSVLEGHGLSQASAAAPTATPRAEEARS